MPRYKYMDDFRPLAEQHPMLSFLFPSSKQVTSAVGTLNAANIGLLSTSNENSSSVLCLVLGDGKDPRTAVLAAVRYGWNVVAIDSKLDKKWKKPKELLPDSCRFAGLDGDMSSFLSEGRDLVQTFLCPIADIDHILIICLDQGENFYQLKSLRGRIGISDLRVLFNNAPATVVSTSSIEANVDDCMMKIRPAYSFVDEEILSTNKQVQIWNFHGSRRPTTTTTTTSNASDRTQTDFRKTNDVHKSKQDSQFSSTSKRHTINSKVSQLKKQQELACERKTQLSNTRRPSVTAFSSQCDLIYQCPQGKSISNASKSLSKVFHRRATLFSEKNTDVNNSTIRRKTEDDNPQSCHMSNRISAEEHTQYELVKPVPVKDGFHFTGIVPPSCMPENISERHARIREIMSTIGFKNDPIQKIKTISSASLTTESTTNSSMHEDDDSVSKSSQEYFTKPQEYKVGDFVQVRIGNIYQAGTIDSVVLKGLYNITLFTDTPAWSEKRSHVDIYQQSPERIPDVLARDIRPFSPAPIGEIIYVFINGDERKCRVHGYTYSKDAEVKAKSMKYVVKFSIKDCDEWRNEKHRVPVQRAYRMLNAVHQF